MEVRVTCLEARNRELEERLGQNVLSLEEFIENVQDYVLDRMEDHGCDMCALVRSVETRVARWYHPYVHWTVPVEESWEGSS